MNTNVKTLTITNVRPILGIDKPVVVFEVLGHEAIVRNPKQAFTDLRNGGRLLDVPENAFVNGYERADQYSKTKFLEALHATRGAQLIGDVRAFKAGDTYVLTEGHPDVVANLAKVGDTKKAEKDGVWVEGFLSIPLTGQESLNRMVASNIADAMLRMYGFGATPQAVSAPQAEVMPTGAPEAVSATEALGELATANDNKGKK